MRANGINAMRCINSNKQCGAVLLISLIILLVMTILGVTAMRTSNLELIMATNAQEQLMALTNAENTLVDAEDDIDNNFPGQYVHAWHTDTTDGYYAQNNPLSLDLANSALEDVDWVDVDSDGEGYAVGANGRYTLEYMGSVKDASAGGTATIGAGKEKWRYFYRITSMATVGKGANRLVQSIYTTIE